MLIRKSLFTLVAVVIVVLALWPFAALAAGELDNAADLSEKKPNEDVRLDSVISGILFFSLFGALFIVVIVAKLKWRSTETVKKGNKGRKRKKRK